MKYSIEDESGAGIGGERKAIYQKQDVFKSALRLLISYSSEPKYEKLWGFPSKNTFFIFPHSALKSFFKK